MSKEKELAKNTIILTVGKICTQFVSFLFLPLYTAILSPEDYGFFDLLNTYIAVLVPIFNWQFENGLYRFMMDCRYDKKKQTEIFSTVIISNTLQSAIYIVCFLLFNSLLTSPHKWFLAVDVVLNIYLNSLLQFPRGIGNNASYAIASFISASSTVLLNVVFICVFNQGIFGMFFATIIGKILSMLYLCITLKVWEHFRFMSFTKHAFKELCKYSLPLVPNQLSWWTISISDRLIVSNLISVAANGIYSIANKFSSIYVTVYNIFNMSWTESVTMHICDDDRNAFMTETINTMFMLFSCLCTGIIACMPFAFSVLINSQYDEAYNQIPILMVAVLFQVVVGLYSVIYVAMKRSVDIAKTSFFAAVINIVVDLLLVKRIGLYAASLSTLAAYSSMAFYRYYHVKRYINIALKKKNVIMIIFVGGVTIGAYYYNNLVICGIVLFFVLLFSFFMNKKFLVSSLKIIILRFNPCKKE